MKKLLSASLFFLLILSTLFIVLHTQKGDVITGAPPDGEPETAAPDTLDPYAWLKNWVRPVGPTRVALQVGHLNSAELPDELARIRGNTGASAAGFTEVETNEKIAEETKRLLEEHGILVDILPATIPEKYYADAFVAIHADGSETDDTHGFKSSAPWRDFSGKSATLNDSIRTSYAEVTDLEWDENISRNMRGYYAFSFWRYTHSVHPMTPSVILETGFLTNYYDRQIIVEQPQIAAKGLAVGIINFLHSESLLQN